MNILLIGNGFDLAHGLPTRYNDFLDFLKYIDTEQRLSSIKIHPEIEKLLTDDNNIEHINEMKRLIYNNIWFEYFLYKENIGPSWCDFEAEMEYVIIHLENFKKLLENNHEFIISENVNVIEGVDVLDFLMHYFAIKFNICRDEIQIKKDASIAVNGEKEYIKVTLGRRFKNPTPILYKIYKAISYEDFINSLLEELKRFTKCFELYLSYFVNKIDIMPISFINKILINDPNIKILSFNYTNTIDKYHKQIFSMPCFIHGQALNNSLDNLVLGINETSNKVDPLFTNFRKYFQRISKNCDRSYRDWINQINFRFHGSKVSLGSEHNRIYIIGHSLGLSDKDILNELITLPGTKTTIYYHNNKNELLQNLAAILGSKTFTEYFENNAIQFIEGEFNKKVQTITNL